MAKGLEAISQIVEEEAKTDREPSRLTYLKKGQSIIARIPEDIISNLHVYKVVGIYQKILPTLSFHSEGREERDLYWEAFQIMKEDHATGKANGTIDRDDKDAYRDSMVLQPKATILFGIIPLEDFVQGKKETVYKAGEPLLLETNLGKDNSNIDMLTQALQKPTNVKKFATRAFEITCISSNKYSFTPVEDEDLTEAQRKVLEDTKGQTVPDDVFDNALFESTLDKQASDLASIGFDTSRLEGISNVTHTETVDQDGTESVMDISDDDIPF